MLLYGDPSICTNLEESIDSSLINRAPLGSTAIIFESLPKALIFRHVNGGWIFESEYHYVWFDSSHTPTAIIQHPLTKGCSGKLI